MAVWRLGGGCSNPFPINHLQPFHPPAILKALGSRPAARGEGNGAGPVNAHPQTGASGTESIGGGRGRHRREFVIRAACTARHRPGGGGGTGRGNGAGTTTGGAGTCTGGVDWLASHSLSSFVAAACGT